MSAPTERNSLCQFWNDSNQKREVPTYARVEIALPPCRAASTLAAFAPPTAWSANESANSAKSASDSDLS